LANPKRFKGKIQQPPKLQIPAWINPPKQETATCTYDSQNNFCISATVQIQHETQRIGETRLKVTVHSSMVAATAIDCCSCSGPLSIYAQLSAQCFTLDVCRTAPRAAFQLFITHVEGGYWASATTAARGNTSE
jgi:hypothetical protein